MRADFDYLPKAFRDKDFASLRPADFAELLIRLEADLRPRSLGASHIFTRALGASWIFNLALFRGERGAVVLHALNLGDDILAVKLCATGMREDVLDFGSLDRTITLHDFNRLGLPIAAYVPVVELLAARERLRGANEKGTSRTAAAGT